MKVAVYIGSSMPNTNIRRKKPVLSMHQKQIRLLTVLSVLLGVVFFVAVLFFLNHSSFIQH
jgi:hypothetical protein